MNIILLISLAIIDALLYGYYYEQKKNKLWFLFWELHYKGRNILPVYRILQGSLDIIALHLVYTNSGLIPLIGFMAAWYLMLKEFSYYILLWQWQVMLDYENNNEDVYWLKRIYFSGYWLFKFPRDSLHKYTFRKFAISAVTGLILIIVSNLI